MVTSLAGSQLVRLRHSLISTAGRDSAVRVPHLAGALNQVDLPVFNLSRYC